MMAGHFEKWNALHTTVQRALLCTSVNAVHNAQVCYFNNVWLMFLVFKNFSFQTTVGPPPPTGGSLYFSNCY